MQISAHGICMHVQMYLTATYCISGSWMFLQKLVVVPKQWVFCQWLLIGFQRVGILVYVDSDVWAEGVQKRKSQLLQTLQTSEDRRARNV